MYKLDVWGCGDECVCTVVYLYKDNKKIWESDWYNEIGFDKGCTQLAELRDELREMQKEFGVLVHKSVWEEDCVWDWEEDIETHEEFMNRFWDRQCEPDTFTARLMRLMKKFFERNELVIRKKDDADL